MPTNRNNMAPEVISRRMVVGSSGLAALGLLSGSTLGRATEKEMDAKKATGQPSKEFLERTEKSKAFMERLSNANSIEERQQIMSDQMAWQRQRAIDDLKGQLGISDKEWPVVKPRLQAVYNLVHPASQASRNEPSGREVGQRSQELRELLRDDKAQVDQIKAKLSALRAAKERAAQGLSRARQNLRQIMSLRQEALLVLNGLLD